MHDVLHTTVDDYVSTLDGLAQRVAVLLEFSG